MEILAIIKVEDAAKLKAMMIKMIKLVRICHLLKLLKHDYRIMCIYTNREEGVGAKNRL